MSCNGVLFAILLLAVCDLRMTRYTYTYVDAQCMLDALPAGSCSRGRRKFCQLQKLKNSPIFKNVHTRVVLARSNPFALSGCVAGSWSKGRRGKNVSLEALLLQVVCLQSVLNPYFIHSSADHDRTYTRAYTPPFVVLASAPSSSRDAFIAAIAQAYVVCSPQVFRFCLCSRERLRSGPPYSCGAGQRHL